MRGLEDDFARLKSDRSSGLFVQPVLQMHLGRGDKLRSAVKMPSCSSSSVLGPSALKAAEGAVKRKESAHGSGQSKEKKKKSALDEIMEVTIAQGSLSL